MWGAEGGSLTRTGLPEGESRSPTVGGGSLARDPVTSQQAGRHGGSLARDPQRMGRTCCPLRIPQIRRGCLPCRLSPAALPRFHANLEMETA